MIRQLPIIPTILVVAAAGVMVWLGFWQLGRAEEKAELIARYSQAQLETEEVEFPFGKNGEDVWFRRASLTCSDVRSVNQVAGTAFNGAKGWVIRVECKTLESEVLATIDIGFSQTLGDQDWSEAAGRAFGVIAPGPRLVLDPPAEGLQALAKPDPNDLPNNHLAYAWQWFFFALTALVIYWFAVRSRINRRSD